jgi:hypothetical protein
VRTEERATKGPSDTFVPEPVSPEWIDRAFREGTPSAHRTLVRAADVVPCGASRRHRIMTLWGTEGQLFFPFFHGLFEDLPGKW